MMIFSCFGITLFLIIGFMIAALYNETQPVTVDALSRLDSNFELIIYIYRLFVSILSIYCMTPYCSWIIIIVSLLSSIYFLVYFFRVLPYYNTAVSNVFGSMLGVYFWVCINALLTKIYTVHGHLIVILVGVPIVAYVMQVLREKKIEWIMTTTIDKFTSDIDCLN